MGSRVGVPSQLRPDHWNLVSPVIVVLSVPGVGRRRCVTKKDLVKRGDTNECQACTQLASRMHNAKVLHDDRCRDRI